MTLPTTRPSNTTSPFVVTIASGKSSNGAVSTPSTVSGSGSARPITLPASFQMFPSASTFFPTSFLGSPSINWPIGIPYGKHLLEFLLLDTLIGENDERLNSRIALHLRRL